MRHSFLDCLWNGAMNKIFCGLLFSLMFVNSAYAITVNITDLAEQVNRMESALKSLQKKLSNNYVGSTKRPVSDGGPSEDKLDAMLMQLQETEQGLRQLTGEIETVRFKQEEIQSRIDRVVADMDVRFSEMEKKLTTAETKFKKMEEEKISAEKAKKQAEKKKKAQEAATAKAEKTKKPKPAH